MGSESLILGIILVGILFGRRIWRRYQDYGSMPSWGDKLQEEELRFLENHLRYYHSLPNRSKQIFAQRVAYFRKAKKFVPREMIAVSWEMSLLISASAIQLTFGFPRVHLSHFQYILVYPGSFKSLATGNMHQGEVNPAMKAIVLGWRSFVEGYLKRDGRNLGLHEMAHALRLENRIMNAEYDFLNKKVLKEWELRATNTMREINQGHETFFRDYGGTNREEFFAVAVENFFERPTEFSEKHPLTYDVLCRLLRQNPKLLFE